MPSAPTYVLLSARSPSSSFAELPDRETDNGQNLTNEGQSLNYRHYSSSEAILPRGRAASEGEKPAYERPVDGPLY